MATVVCLPHHPSSPSTFTTKLQFCSIICFLKMQSICVRKEHTIHSTWVFFIAYLIIGIPNSLKMIGSKPVLKLISICYSPGRNFKSCLNIWTKPNHRENSKKESSPTAIPVIYEQRGTSLASGWLPANEATIITLLDHWLIQRLKSALFLDLTMSLLLKAFWIFSCF